MAFQAAAGGLQAVQNGRSYLDTLANKYVVKPKGAKGIGGFTFDYEGDTRVTMKTDITDHYVEDNSAVQDHAGLAPKRLTLRGFKAELAKANRSGLLGVIPAIQDKLGEVPAYLGKYTPQTVNTLQAALTRTQSTVTAIDQGLARVKNIVGYFSGAAPKDSRQKEAFATLEALRDSRQIFVVETPYRVFDNMMIETLDFLQPDGTRSWSDIQVTLKEIRTVGVDSIPYYLATFGGRAAAQRGAQVDSGKTQGKQKDTSDLYEFFVGK